MSSVVAVTSTGPAVSSSAVVVSSDGCNISSTVVMTVKWLMTALKTLIKLLVFRTVSKDSGHTGKTLKSTVVSSSTSSRTLTDVDDTSTKKLTGRQKTSWRKQRGNQSARKRQIADAGSSTRPAAKVDQAGHLQQQLQQQQQRARCSDVKAAVETAKINSNTIASVVDDDDSLVDEDRQHPASNCYDEVDGAIDVSHVNGQIPDELDDSISGSDCSHRKWISAAFDTETELRQRELKLGCGSCGQMDETVLATALVASERCNFRHSVESIERSAELKEATISGSRCNGQYEYHIPAARFANDKTDGSAVGFSDVASGLLRDDDLDGKSSSSSSSSVSNAARNQQKQLANCEKTSTKVANSRQKKRNRKKKSAKCMLNDEKLNSGEKRSDETDVVCSVQMDSRDCGDGAETSVKDLLELDPLGLLTTADQQKLKIAVTVHESVDSQHLAADRRYCSRYLDCETVTCTTTRNIDVDIKSHGTATANDKLGRSCFSAWSPHVSSHQTHPVIDCPQSAVDDIETHATPTPALTFCDVNTVVTSLSSVQNSSLAGNVSVTDRQRYRPAPTVITGSSFSTDRSSVVGGQPLNHDVTTSSLRGVRKVVDEKEIKVSRRQSSFDPSAARLFLYEAFQEAVAMSQQSGSDIHRCDLIIYCADNC